MDVSKYTSPTEIFQKTFESVKADNPAINVEKFAKRVGLGTSTLKLILSGRRKPNIHQVLSLAKGLRLSPSETSYLETLVLKDNAKNNWEKAYYAKILPMKKKDITLSTVTTSKQFLLSDAKLLPLLVYLMEEENTDLNYSHLSKELGISEDKILELVEQLKEKDILEKQNDGKFHVAFDKLGHRLAQKKYQKSLLAEAIERVDTEYDKETSLFANYAFSANDESLIKLQMELKALMEKYMSDDGMTGKRTQVAQACFQIFPVIKSEIKKR